MSVAHQTRPLMSSSWAQVPLCFLLFALMHLCSPCDLQPAAPLSLLISALGQSHYTSRRRRAPCKVARDAMWKCTTWSMFSACPFTILLPSHRLQTAQGISSAPFHDKRPHDMHSKVAACDCSVHRPHYTHAPPPNLSASKALHFGREGRKHSSASLLLQHVCSARALQ